MIEKLFMLKKIIYTIMGKASQQGFQQGRSKDFFWVGVVWYKLPTENNYWDQFFFLIQQLPKVLISTQNIQVSQKKVH